MGFSCKNCEREFTSLQIAFSWPTKIICKGCKTRHHFNRGNTIGGFLLLLAIATAIAAMLIVNVLSLASEENGLYRMSGVQILVFFLWPVIYAFPYIVFLKYYKFELKKSKTV